MDRQYTRIKELEDGIAQLSIVHGGDCVLHAGGYACTCGADDSLAIIDRLQQGKDQAMAFGDTGGAVTELIITCKVNSHAISKGEPVGLIGNYGIYPLLEGERIFGQAMSDGAKEGDAVPVKVRGVCVFNYTGPAPDVDGFSGVLASNEPGAVKATGLGNVIRGLNVAVFPERNEVHVLL